MKQRSWKWTLGLLMALVVILAGCSQASVAPATNESASTGTAEEASTKIEKPRVAFVYIGTPGDGGWTYEHDRGRKYMEEKLGITATTVENVPESADAERVITELAQKNDIIFTTSFGYMEYTLNVAKNFPNVKFMHAAGYKTADNVGTYFGRNYQASYLAGIAAGELSKNNQIGYVGAFPIPEVIYNINAFTLGARSVKPEAEVSVVWTNTWYDPTTERQAAVSLLDQGVDVLAAYQDSPAALQAAQERGVYGIGNDSDMNKYAPETYVTSPIWNWGPYYTEVVQSVIDGTWKSGSYWGGLKDGIVDLAPFGKSVPEKVQTDIEAIKEKVSSGELNVFQGPIKDQSGAEKVASGSTLSDEDILSTNWFVEGVKGTIPQ